MSAISRAGKNVEPGNLVPAGNEGENVNSRETKWKREKMGRMKRKKRKGKKWRKE